MADVEAFWRRFVAATGIDGPYTAWGFGSSPEQATELGLLVRDGPKRATASLVSSYAGDGHRLVVGVARDEARRRSLGPSRTSRPSSVACSGLEPNPHAV